MHSECVWINHETPSVSVRRCYINERGDRHESAWIDLDRTRRILEMPSPNKINRIEVGGPEQDFFVQRFLPRIRP